MTSTYSPCTRCGKINRVAISRAAGKKPVCGSCKSELPLHGAVNELGQGDLLALLQKAPVPVVADFWAPWCGPCLSFAPTFERVAGELGGEVIFVKVNTEANRFAGETYGFRSIPTLIFFRNGLEVGRQAGALPAEMLTQWLKQQLGKRVA